MGRECILQRRHSHSQSHRSQWAVSSYLQAQPQPQWLPPPPAPHSPIPVWAPPLSLGWSFLALTSGHCTWPCGHALALGTGPRGAPASPGGGVRSGIAGSQGPACPALGDTEAGLAGPLVSRPPSLHLLPALGGGDRSSPLQAAAGPRPGHLLPWPLGVCLATRFALATRAQRHRSRFSVQWVFFPLSLARPLLPHRPCLHPYAPAEATYTLPTPPDERAMEARSFYFETGTVRMATHHADPEPATSGCGRRSPSPGFPAAGGEGMWASLPGGRAWPACKGILRGGGGS